MPDKEPPQATARSPFAGCLILILALLMLVSLVGFAVWLPFKQATEMEKFTSPTPAPLPVETVDQAKLAELTARMEKFSDELKGDAKTPARMELSVEDLNLAIAAYKPVEQLRGTFRVKEITQEALLIDINYKLNGKPRLARDGEDGPITADPRYLIGSLKGHPLLARRELALKVSSLEVPGKTVAEGFMEHFSTLRIFEAATKDGNIGPAMAALTRAELAPGKLILARVPGESPPEVVGDAAFREGGGRIVKWLGILACVFLAFVGIIVFVGIRKQRRLKNSGETSRGDGGA
ncbi:hypothetical protein [Haloferula sp. BvORR071]|uniref:hypothetical protein n=1 Tax=Haloferula sp. BvORR071 TaxID=1396141 RepID=UPI0005562BB2|nr:hypothetical protein [Haloferula sp. BvORR071]